MWKVKGREPLIATVRQNKMIPGIDNWRPIEVAQIQALLGSFRGWCLCGGQSLDWLVRRKTRTHGDTDIGVFRSELLLCLEQIAKKRVFLCNPPGSLMPWDGGQVPDSVHDIWITDLDGGYWVLQIMVYDDNGGEVVYRRNPQLRWSKRDHSMFVAGIPVLNPLVTLLFKLNKNRLEAKDIHDVQTLIQELANHAVHAIGAGAPQHDG